MSGDCAVGCPSLDVLQPDDVLAGTALLLYSPQKRNVTQNRTKNGSVNGKKARQSTFKILEHILAKTPDIDSSLFL